MDSTSVHGSTNDTRIYRPHIDGLRAIAVLAVLFFHVEINGFSGGFVGVDIFFVISGYLITKNIVSDIQLKRWSFRNFYVRRWRRLFPASFFVLILCFIFASLFLPPSQMAVFGRSFLYAITYLSNFFFWSESGYFEVAAKYKPLLHMWSLGVEEQFYLIWPLTLVMLKRVQQRFFLPLALITMCGFSLILSEVFWDIDPAAVFYLLPFRIFEFALGAIIVWLPPMRKEHFFRQELLLFIGFLLIYYSITQYSESTPFPGVYALVPCLGAAVAIYAGNSKYLGFLLRNRLAVSVGLISYSVYLVHWPLIVFYKYWAFEDLIVTTKLAIILLSLGIGFLTYRFVEQAFRHPAKTSERFNGWGYIATCLSLVMIVAIPAAHASFGDGWRWRVKHSENRKKALEELSYPDVNCEPKQNFPGCFLGKDQVLPPDVLLIGDSHSRALWPAFDYIGKKHNLTVLAWHFLGCPPIINTRKKYFGPQFKQYEDNCAEVIENWEQYIIRTKPKVVVLAARWAVNFEPQLGSEPPIPGDILLDKKNPVDSIEEARRVFVSHLKDTVSTITKLGSKVIVISQVPVYLNNPGACFDMPTYLRFDEEDFRDRCQHISYEKVREHLRFTDDTITNVAKNNDSVLPVLMSEFFCDDANRRCKFEDNDIILYEDNNHLNKYGSIFAAKRMEERVVNFIRDD